MGHWRASHYPQPALQPRTQFVSRIRNALTARDRLVWYLVMVVVLLGALLAHAQYRLVTVQTDITMHVPPDLSRGARLKPNRPEPSSVYLYTQHIWQQINEWLSSGTTDYRAAIDQYQCYVSPDRKSTRLNSSHVAISYAVF